MLKDSEICANDFGPYLQKKKMYQALKNAILWHAVILYVQNFRKNDKYEILHIMNNKSCTKWTIMYKCMVFKTNDQDHEPIHDIVHVNATIIETDNFQDNICYISYWFVRWIFYFFQQNKIIIYTLFNSRKCFSRNNFREYGVK